MNTPVPPRLYKYRQLPRDAESRETEELARRRAELVDQLFYFAPPSALNDPYDCSPTIRADLSPADLLKQRIRVGKRLTGQDRATRSRTKKLVESRLRDGPWIQRLWTESRDSTGHLCLSARNDVHLMWSHYADGHRGYAIELAVDWKHAAPIGLPLKVVYANERPTIRVSEFSPPRKDAPPDFLARAMLTKHDIWAYEKEWRLVRSQQGRGPGLIRIPRAWITGIVLGACIPKPHERLLRQWAGAAKLDVRWTRVTHRESAYDLSFETGC